MKEISGYLGIPIFLLVSTWGLLKTVLDVVERLNRIRDFALGLPKEARDIPSDLRHLMFYSDWLPVWFGLVVAVAISSAVFFMIPAIFREMHKQAQGEQATWANALMARSFFGFSHIQVACFGLGALTAFACLSILIAGLGDWHLVSSRQL